MASKQTNRVLSAPKQVEQGHSRLSYCRGQFVFGVLPMIRPFSSLDKFMRHVISGDPYTKVNS